MCTDVHLSIESKSIIRGKNFNHPTLYTTTTHQIIAHSIIHNNLNSKQNETSDKCLEWNHGNGFHTRHLFSHHCFICFPSGCSFHFQTHHQTGCSTAYLEERFSDTFRLSPVLCIHRLLESIYMYVRKRNSKIQQLWNSSISQRLSPFLRIIATEQAILLHNGENHIDHIVTSGDSDSACPVSINTNRFGVVIHFFHPRCTFQSSKQLIKRVSATSSLNHLGICPY